MGFLCYHVCMETFKQLSIFDCIPKKKSGNKYIKAATLANKAVSMMFGYPKMVKKADMTLEMLKEREAIVEKINALIEQQELGFDIPSVSKLIYESIHTT